MKVVAILILFSHQALCYDFDDWESTEYIYLAKPIYIYKVESHIEDLGGKLGNGLKDLMVKVKQKSESKNSVYYYFEIQEVFYGKVEENISLEFEFKGEYKECNMNNTFQNHNKKEFWNTDLGRSEYSNIKRVNTNCFGEYKDTRQVNSCFEMDKLYLLIGNDKLKTKQYELIESKNDEWLKFVRAKAKELKKTKN